MDIYVISIILWQKQLNSEHTQGVDPIVISPLSLHYRSTLKDSPRKKFKNPKRYLYIVITGSTHVLPQ